MKKQSNEPNPVEQLMVERNMEAVTYRGQRLSIFLDRATGRRLVVLDTEGGFAAFIEAGADHIEWEPTVKEVKQYLEREVPRAQAHPAG